MPVALDATGAASVEIRVLANPIITTKLERVRAANPRQPIRETEIVRREIKRTAITHEFQLILPTVLEWLLNTEKDNAGALAANIDVRDSQVRRDVWVEAKRAINTGIEDPNVHPRYARPKIVDERGRKRMRLAQTNATRVAEFITGAKSGWQVITVWRRPERKIVISCS